MVTESAVFNPFKTMCQKCLFRSPVFIVRVAQINNSKPQTHVSTPHKNIENILIVMLRNTGLRLRHDFFFFFCPKSLAEGSAGRYCCLSARSRVFSGPAEGFVFDFSVFWHAQGKMLYKRGYLQSSPAFLEWGVGWGGLLLSVRLAVFFKTMAGQAEESGSRGGGKKPWIPQSNCGVFFWKCKAGAAAAAGFSNAVIEAACRAWWRGGAESGGVECTRVREKSEIDGCLRYHIPPPEATSQQPSCSRLLHFFFFFFLSPSAINKRNKPRFGGGVGSKRANWTRAFDSSRKSQTFGRN